MSLAPPPVNKGKKGGGVKPPKPPTPPSPRDYPENTKPLYNIKFQLFTQLVVITMLSKY